MARAEKRVEEAEEAERAAIDDGYASAEVLAEEVARLSEELELHQMEAAAGMSGLETQAKNEVETLQAKLETQGTDFAYLTRKHEVSTCTPSVSCVIAVLLAVPGTAVQRFADASAGRGGRRVVWG